MRVPKEMVFKTEAPYFVGNVGID
jgi:hypothetical protein